MSGARALDLTESCALCAQPTVCTLFTGFAFSAQDFGLRMWPRPARLDFTASAPVSTTVGLEIDTTALRRDVIPCARVRRQAEMAARLVACGHLANRLRVRRVPAGSDVILLSTLLAGSEAGRPASWSEGAGSAALGGLVGGWLARRPALRRRVSCLAVADLGDVLAAPLGLGCRVRHGDGFRAEFFADRADERGVRPVVAGASAGYLPGTSYDHALDHTQLCWRSACKPCWLRVASTVLAI